jgi:hypothetical protein
VAHEIRAESADEGVKEYAECSSSQHPNEWFMTDFESGSQKGKKR